MAKGKCIAFLTSSGDNGLNVDVSRSPLPTNFFFVHHCHLLLHRPNTPHAPANAGTTAPDPDYASMSPLQLLIEKQKWFDMKAQAVKNTIEENERRTAAYQELNTTAEKALANLDEILTLSQKES